MRPSERRKIARPGIDAQRAVIQNARTQTSLALQKFLRARREGMIHPRTRPALFRSLKTNPLHFEFFSNQSVQINPMRNYVAAGRRWRQTPA